MLPDPAVRAASRSCRSESHPPHLLIAVIFVALCSEMCQPLGRLCQPLTPGLCQPAGMCQPSASLCCCSDSAAAPRNSRRAKGHRRPSAPSSWRWPIAGQACGRDAANFHDSFACGCAAQLATAQQTEPPPSSLFIPPRMPRRRLGGLSCTEGSITNSGRRAIHTDTQ